MELKEFIETSILDICSGVKEAQEKAVDFNAIISPGFYSSLGNPCLDSNRSAIQMIDFDIAVSVTNSKIDEDKTGIGAKISVLGINIDFNEKGSNKNTNATNNVSRIKFSIPVLFPIKQ